MQKLTSEQHQTLLHDLQERFEKHMSRHEGLSWKNVEEKIQNNEKKLWSLHEMERTGGEPDVVILDGKSETIVFCDCSAESPKGRRSLCYDREALESRKLHKPKDSALDVANTIGIEILTEEQYRGLQRFGEFDRKTSSWIKTPPEIRKRGGAVFCDRRYDHVFLYHNGADSYYAARGFRGLLKI